MKMNQGLKCIGRIGRFIFSAVLWTGLVGGVGMDLGKRNVWGGLGPIGFETGEGFGLGDPIDLYSGWSTEGGEISEEEAGEGSRSLALFPLQTGIAGAERLVQPMEWGSENVAFFTTWILPGSSEDEELFAAEINVDGARVRFYQVTVESEQVGLIFAVSAETTGDVEVDTLLDYAVIEQVGAEEWMRVDLRLDYGVGAWDLYVDGFPLLTDLALPSGVFAPIFQEFSGAEDGSSTAFIDGVKLSTTNTLFVDTNRDGLPDAWERTYGMNLMHNNRDGDPDGDGVRNIEEYFSGTSPLTHNSSNQPDLVFVDVGVGNDGNTGFYPYPAAGLEGPKASVTSGIQAVNAGVVVVQEGIYVESNFNIQGKQVTLKPMGNVIIH